VTHLHPSWTKPDASPKKEYWRVTGTDRLPIPLSKYSSKAPKSVYRQVFTLPTRMGPGGKRFDYDLLKAKRNRWDRVSLVPLRSLKHPLVTPVWKLEAALYAG